MPDVNEHLDTAKAQLRRHGFASLHALFTDSELQAIEEMLDPLVLSASPAYRKSRRELSEDHRAGALRQPEFSRPSAAARALKHTAVYAKCQRVAENFLGGRAHYLFDHAIYKMPRSGAGTPWHQDQAYLGRSVRIRAVHFWIPLQETDTTNGCMRFVAGSHQAELEPHISAYAGNPHVLKTGADYGAVAVDFPLRKGDVGIHTNLTLHSSGPNESNDIRKAWIIHFGDRSIWYKRMMQLRDGAALTALGSRWLSAARGQGAR